MSTRTRTRRSLRAPRFLRTLRHDDGFSVVEPVILAPIFIAMLLIVVAAGRVQDAAGQLTGAARDGARAASLSRTPDAARTAAEQAVAASVTVQDLRCAGGPSTSIDTGGFAPGGQVRVTVTCVVDLADVAMTGVPGAHTITRTATSPLETYRGDS